MGRGYLIFGCQIIWHLNNWQQIQSETAKLWATAGKTGIPLLCIWTWNTMSALRCSNLIHLFIAQQVSSIKIVYVCAALPQSHEHLCCKARQTHKSSLDQRNHWIEITPCGSLLPHSPLESADAYQKLQGLKNKPKGALVSPLVSPAQPAPLLGWCWVTPAPGGLWRTQDCTRCYQHTSAVWKISSSGSSLSPQQAAWCTGSPKGCDSNSVGCSGWSYNTRVSWCISLTPHCSPCISFMATCCHGSFDTCMNMSSRAMSLLSIFHATDAA